MDNEMHEREDNKFIPMTSITSQIREEVINDIFYYTDQIVNVSIIGYPKEGEWFLIDAGLPYAAEESMSVATERFGEGSKPKVIILTHAQFEHVGGVVELVKAWGVPVYAHELVIPYLSGVKSYP